MRGGGYTGMYGDGFRRSDMSYNMTGNINLAIKQHQSTLDSVTVHVNYEWKGDLGIPKSVL